MMQVKRETKMKKLVAITTLILLMVAAVLPQTGCKGETEETEPAPSESNRWLELLRVLPKNEVTLKGSYLQDFAYLDEKKQQYPQITKEYAVSHGSVISRSSLFSNYYNLTDPDADVEGEYKNTLGFTLDNVGQMISSGEDPHVYEAYHGNFNKADIDNAVKTGPLNDLLEIVQYGDSEFYSWGGDDEFDLDRRSNVRPLGRGHRLALVDDFIFWMVWTDGIEDMIDSYSDKIDSLADIEEYQLMAEELAALDVFHAYFSMDTNSYSDMTDWLEQSGDMFPIRPEQQERLEEAIYDTALLKPYKAFATGAGLDKDGYYLAIVLLNPDEDTAANNASLLEKRINETENVWQGNSWLDWIDDMQIESKGRLTTAKMYGAICEFWWQRFEYLDPRVGGVYEPLLLHE